jgi:hypothetical protein
VDYDGAVPPSSRIDRYHPDALLGSAGLVDTYRTRVQGKDALAVLKVLFLDRAEGSIAGLLAERFLAAGQRAQKAETPGIARVLEVSDDPEAVFVATERVPGVDLAGLVELARKRGDGQVPVQDPILAELLCARVGRVLAAAHELTPPLFHLGLCPGNVVVTPSAEVVVMDFGLAASVRGVGACPMEKWHFVAPELLGVDATSLSPESARAADLYSLGALLYFLLAGRPPIEGATLAELSEKADEPLPDLAGVPNRLLAAIRALTTPDAKERPESAGAAVEWLSGGIESAQERESHLAKALRGLGLDVESTVRQERPTVRAKAIVGFSSLPPTHAKNVPAPAMRHRPGHRSSRALIAGGAVLLLGALAWGGLRAYRGSRDGGRQGKVGEPASPASRESLLASQAEILVPMPMDGGLHPRGLEERVTGPSYVPKSEGTPSRVPNHLFLDTDPSQADVWVDGVLRGKTPVDLVVGPGSHRVVAVKAGYLMLRAVFDTTRGEYARRGLQRAGFPNFGDAFLDLRCEHADKYPVVLDDEETGLLCPVSMLPVASGKHSVGIFVPARKAVVTVEVTVRPGREPKRVMLTE